MSHHHQLDDALSRRDADVLLLAVYTGLWSCTRVLLGLGRPTGQSLIRSRRHIIRGLKAPGRVCACIDSATKDCKIAFAQALSGIFLKVKRRRWARSNAPRQPPFSLVTEVGSNYTPWEHSEAYAYDFGSESYALTPENTIISEKKPESTGT